MQIIALDGYKVVLGRHEIPIGPLEEIRDEFMSLVPGIPVEIKGRRPGDQTMFEIHLTAMVENPRHRQYISEALKRPIAQRTDLGT